MNPRPLLIGRVEGGVWKWKVPGAWGSVSGGGRYEAAWTGRSRRVKIVDDARRPWDFIVKGRPALSEFDVLCCGSGLCVTRGEKGEGKYLVWKRVQTGELSEKRERMKREAERLNKAQRGTE